MPIRLPYETVQNWSIECSEDQAFVCINGQRAKSVRDLVKIFERMSLEDYNYHVTKDKNDFAAWVEGVFHNGHLAANFRSARSLKESYQYVKRHQLMLERNLRDHQIKADKKAKRQARKD